VESLGWYPLTNYLLPPVASHPVGVHAYRTIAYEIAESMRWQVPDWVVVPVSRGDGLFGIWAGFVDLHELGWTATVPRMLAVERFPSLSDAMQRDLEQPERVADGDPNQARSIGDRLATTMSLLTVRHSGGTAVSCDDEQLWAAWRALATNPRWSCSPPPRRTLRPRSAHQARSYSRATACEWPNQTIRPH
jgi:threonine synthase